MVNKNGVSSSNIEKVHKISSNYSHSIHLCAKQRKMRLLPAVLFHMDYLQVTLQAVLIWRSVCLIIKYYRGHYKNSFSCIIQSIRSIPTYTYYRTYIWYHQHILYNNKTAHNTESYSHLICEQKWKQNTTRLSKLLYYHEHILVMLRLMS